MNNLYKYGYPDEKRDFQISLELKDSTEKFIEEYRGNLMELPVIEVPIELLVYRIENVRTKSYHKQYLAENPNARRDLFVHDINSIETQEVQHKLLLTLAAKENLLKTFKNDGVRQKQPIIISRNGTVVNGNRRLCVWRNLYYSDNKKYSYFQKVKVAVLPDNDQQAIYELEVRLQIVKDMKAAYDWHTIAADYKEKQDRGIDLNAIAKLQDKSIDDINMYIQCYDYANDYLASIGHPDEWSLLDKSFYAFQTIVECRKKIKKPGEKFLFQEIAKCVLQTEKKDRTYSVIKKINKNLPQIAAKLKNNLEIDLVKKEDEIGELFGINEDSTSDFENRQIASQISKYDTNADMKRVVDITQTAIKEEEELLREKNKQTFVLNQVSKAAKELNAACVELYRSDMIKKGVKEHLETIRNNCLLLEDWLKL